MDREFRTTPIADKLPGIAPPPDKRDSADNGFSSHEQCRGIKRYFRKT